EEEATETEAEIENESMEEAAND